MNFDIRSEICKTIDTIIEQRLKDNKKDYTITGEIIECLDESLGSYKIKYQNSVFTAYSYDNTIIYNPGETVNITIPNGDFARDKQIINNTSAEATNFLPLINIYSTIKQTSENALKDIETITLSNKDKNYRESLYLDFLQNPINYAMQKEDTFIVEANLRVHDIEELEGKINFGFKISVDVFKNLKTDDIKNEDYRIVDYANYDKLAEEAKVNSDIKLNQIYFYETKTFDFTIGDMNGNPFNYTKDTHIYKIFNISKESIYKLKSVEVYMDQYNTDKDYSVIFSNIKLYTGKQYSQDLWNTYMLRIKSNLYPFYYAESMNGTLNLETELLVRGRRVDFEHLSVTPVIYWFREDASVDLGSEYYSSFGGVGWKCLNNKIYYSDNDFFWANGDYKISLPMEELGKKERFKMILHYGGSRQIIDKAYIKFENTFYKNEKGYDTYNIKSYFTEMEQDILKEPPIFWSDILTENIRDDLFDKNFENYFILRCIVPETDGSLYRYYWSKSDINGLSSIETQNAEENILKVYAKDVSDYAYFTCTVKDSNDKVIFNSYIKISNAINNLNLISVARQTRNIIDVFGTIKDLQAAAAKSNEYDLLVWHKEEKKEGNL